MSVRFFILLYIFVSSMFIKSYAQSQYFNLKFENHSTSDGISSSTCTEIFEDSEGFMWFGTIDGLNRYDGYTFEIYRPILNDSTSISNNRINAIVEDTMGNLWIGTSNGLNVFDKKLERFHRIPLHKGTSNFVEQGEIINDLLFDDTTNFLWVATKNGVIKINLTETLSSDDQNLTFEHYVTQKENEESIDNNDVTDVIKDKDGGIWAITEGDYLNLYNVNSKLFLRVQINILDAYKLNHKPKEVLIDNDGDFWIGNNLSKLIFWDRTKNEFKQIPSIGDHIPIFHMYQDKRGIIWIATDGDGIYLFDKNKGLIQHIVHSPTNEFSLPNNQPSKILEDKNGIFWVATYNEGISKLVLSKSAFGHYYYELDKKNGLSAKIAQSVLQDSSGELWIGTDGGGLNLFNEKNKSFKHYRADSKDPYALSSDKIVYLLESFDKSIWVCTWDGGLNKFNPRTEKAEQYKYDTENPFSIGQNTVWCAVEDSEHRLWLGTQTEGLNLFNPKSKKFYKFKNRIGDSTSLVSNFVFSIFIDSQKRLLIGTSLGLSIVELDSLNNYIPTKIEFKELKEKPIEGNRINYITEDHNGNIWLGTDIGMCQLNPELKLERFYTTTDGLPNNLILGIEEDYNNNLWITTKSSLSKLEIKENVFYNFNTQDGVQGVEFQSKSIDKTNDGRIIAGGINGFNIFNPDEVVLKSQSLKPIITKLKMFNEVVKVGQRYNNKIVLNQSISNTNTLALKYNQGFLSFDFVAFHYKNQQRVKYMYRMLGLHEDFISVGEERSANYSSIPPGDYVFQVKASVDGKWEDAESTVININISPPFWKTWWAYLIYILLFLVLFWVVMHYYTKIIKEEKEHELDQMKLRFFINVSHELRTPLTLILNPIDKILSVFDKPEDVKSSALTIQRSARRLLYLVNQLLDFRKMDLGKDPLKLIQSDFIKFGKDIFLLFEDLAETKKIEYKFDSSVKTLSSVFDPDKVEKIITNLLSNAIKFTEREGSINLSISKVTFSKKERLKCGLKKNGRGEFVQIKVKDTGVGFKQEHLKNVFNRFFHADNTRTGTGIGLNFTKGLVELHGGKIYVESEYKKGSLLTVLLPINPKMSDKQKVENNFKHEFKNYDLNIVKSAEYEIAISNENDDTIEIVSEDKGSEKPSLLIVEDNKELRKHLKNELQNSYKIIEAVNGVKGMEMIKKHYPEIIISDIMMPEMDGFELCRLVKTEIETCHIPVILLTARNLEEDKIEGYKTGADEYLPKPFNINVLKARVKNLLDAKKRLRDKFAAMGGVLASSEVTSNTLDEAFLDKATKAIIDNISDVDFKLDNLLKEIGIGRSQFYRKINSLTGQNPSSFIRTIRLKYASELLLKRENSIKEITYMSGFNSMAYFSKTFRELYKLTPSQFVEQKTKDLNI